MLLTDGLPYPREGQGEQDIANFVMAHPDIPLFVILLQGSPTSDPEFERYTRFWERLARENDFIQTYRVEKAEELAKTYHDILARLQHVNPSSGYDLNPGEVLDVYVDQYVQKLSITIIHPNAQDKGVVEIRDPRGQLVDFNEPGVRHFRGEQNPIESISIGTSRLDQAPRNDVWTITSDTPVSVFLDYQGAYDIQFVAPPVGDTTMPNQYLVTDPVTPSRPLVIQLKLVDKAGNVVKEPQPLVGEVSLPDGSKRELAIPQDIAPDGNGVYSIEYDFAAHYPEIMDHPGRFIFTFMAGEATRTEDELVPIARADLIVDVGVRPYIAQISPIPVACQPNQPAQLTVQVGDYQIAATESMHVKVIGAGSEVTLSQETDGVFSGSVDTLCAALLQKVPCGVTSEDTTFRVRLVAGSKDGAAYPPDNKKLPVQVISMACTPTPTPTATVTPTPTLTPTPTPTPIPNTDQDSLNDLEDRCPQQAEWAWAPYFHGCPPAWWMIALAAILILLVLAFLVVFFIPWLNITFISKPPSGYVLVCQDGKAIKGPVSLASIGRRVRRSKITIGSKGHLKVNGLKDVEFIVERHGTRTIIKDAESGRQRAQLNERTPIPLRTSNPSIQLRFALNKETRLKC